MFFSANAPVDGIIIKISYLIKYMSHLHDSSQKRLLILNCLGGTVTSENEEKYYNLLLIISFKENGQFQFLS